MVLDKDLDSSYNDDEEYDEEYCYVSNILVLHSLHFLAGGQLVIEYFYYSIGNQLRDWLYNFFYII